MSWQQLRLRIHADQLADLEQRLLDHGAAAITMLDGKDEPVFQREPGSTPLWEDTVIQALFPSDLDLTTFMFELALEPAVRQLFPPQALEDQVWERAWMDNFAPMRFGQRLWICPSGQTPPQPEAVNLILDPGLAFGTGTHPTTALCLRWLDANPPAGKTVIDYGCGSGVLALAALLLEAEQVLAVDNDPQALTATADNRQRNLVAEQRLRCFSPEALPMQTVDLLVANILAEPLIDLAPRLCGLLKPGAQILLSGLLDTQVEELASHYVKYIEFEPAQISEGWALLTGVRNSQAT